MKICPNCKYECSDEAKYCVQCKTSLGRVVPEEQKKWYQKKGKGWGCLIGVIIGILVLLLLTLLPGSPFNPSAQSSFGEWITPYFGRWLR